MHGHDGRENELDHRPDLSKHLCAAEEHARAIHADWAKLLRDLRHNMDGRNWIAQIEDVQILRRIWLQTISPILKNNYGCHTCAPTPKPAHLLPVQDNKPAQKFYDVVVPLADAVAAADSAPELRYALRSMAANLQGMGMIHIVSATFPRWLMPSGIKHIQCSDRKGWKDYNIIKKTLSAIEAGVSREFVLWSDDQFLLKPAAADALLPFTEGNAAAWTADHWQKLLNSKTTTWWRRFKNTVDALKDRGYKTYNFDSHHPRLIDGPKFKAVMEQFKVMDDSAVPKHGYTIQSLYFNAIKAPERKSEGLLRHVGASPAESTRMWNVNEPADWPRAEKILRTIFPEPAIWELQTATTGPLGAKPEKPVRNLICTLTSGNFLIGTAALLTSLQKNNPKYAGDIGVIDINLNETQKASLRKICNSIKFFPAPAAELNGLINKTFDGAHRNRFNSLEVFRIGQAYSKILFIDSDIIINGSITELFNTCPDNQIAAVKDQNGEANTGFFMVPHQICGALPWHKITDAIKKHTGQRTDQAIVNKIFGDNYYQLDRRYNQIYRHELTAGHKYQPGDEKAIAAHFTGSTKPWRNPEDNAWIRLHDSYIRQARDLAGPEYADNIIAFSGTSLRREDWLKLKEYLLALKKQLPQLRAVEIGAGLVSTPLLDIYCDTLTSFEDNAQWARRIQASVSGQVIEYDYPRFPTAPEADFCLVDGPTGRDHNWRLESMRWAAQNYRRVAVHDIDRPGDLSNMQTIFAAGQWTETARTERLAILEKK